MSPASSFSQLNETFVLHGLSTVLSRVEDLPEVVVSTESPEEFRDEGKMRNVVQSEKGKNTDLDRQGQPRQPVETATNKIQTMIQRSRPEDSPNLSLGHFIVIEIFVGVFDLSRVK